MSEPFANQNDKMSYAMGMNLGEYLNSNPVGLNLDAAVEGLRDSIAGTPRLSRQEYVSAMQLLQQQIQEAGRRQMEQAAAANALAEKNFMAENAKRPGVTVTASGLQYEVLRQGSGAKPAVRPAGTGQVRGLVGPAHCADPAPRRGPERESCHTGYPPGASRPRRRRRRARTGAASPVGVGRRRQPGAFPLRPSGAGQGNGSAA